VHDVAVARVEGNAGELGDLQVGVEVRPDRLQTIGGAEIDIAQAPDAAVVAVEQVAVDIESQGVVVGVRAVAADEGGAGGHVGPGGAPVGAPDNGVASAGVDDARGANDVGIGGVGVDDVRVRAR